MIHTVKGFSVVNEAEVDVFSGILLLFLWSNGCWQLISCSSAFSKSSLYIQRSNCQHPLNHRKSKRIPEKTSVSASLTIPKPLIVWITTNWKIFKMMRTPDDFTCLLRNQDKKQQLEPDMEQQTGSKLGKEYIKAIYCHLAYLTYMQSTSCKMLGWMKHKLGSRLPGEISATSDMQMTKKKN